MFFVLTDARGSVQVTVRFMDVDEDEHVAPEQHVTLIFNSPLSVVEFPMVFNDVPFDDTGEYRIQLFAGNALLIERTLHVVQTSEQA